MHGERAYPWCAGCPTREVRSRLLAEPGTRRLGISALLCGMRVLVSRWSRTIKNYRDAGPDVYCHHQLIPLACRIGCLPGDCRRDVKVKVSPSLKIASYRPG